MPKDPTIRIVELQGGQASLSSGSVVVTFDTAFSGIPHVVASRISAGTSLVEIIPTGISATGFTLVSREVLNAGGTFYAEDGTSAEETVDWFAYTLGPITQH